MKNSDWKPEYSRWRHGGWYVHNVTHLNGGCGCVSRNYPDKKWRIVCDPRRDELGKQGDFTFPNRDAAARAELDLVNELKANQPSPSLEEQYPLNRYSQLLTAEQTVEGKQE